MHRSKMACDNIFMYIANEFECGIIYVESLQTSLQVLFSYCAFEMLLVLFFQHAQNFSMRIAATN